jgi:hypothetical protein
LVANNNLLVNNACVFRNSWNAYMCPWFYEGYGSIQLIDMVPTHSLAFINTTRPVYLIILLAMETHIIFQMVRLCLELFGL